jgi:hypothetical protein
MGTPILERVRLPAGLSDDLQRALGSLQNNVEQSLGRISKDIVPGVLLTGVTIASGGTTWVEHGLGREAKGFLVVDKNLAGDVWRSANSRDRPKSHIGLATDADASLIVSLWVF